MGKNIIFYGFNEAYKIKNIDICFESLVKKLSNEEDELFNDHYLRFIVYKVALIFVKKGKLEFIR